MGSEDLRWVGTASVRCPVMTSVTSEVCGLEEIRVVV
jgi:hypothetical protein